MFKQAITIGLEKQAADSGSDPEARIPFALLVGCCCCFTAHAVSWTIYTDMRACTHASQAHCHFSVLNGLLGVLHESGTPSR
jgi:predicted transporter